MERDEPRETELKLLVDAGDLPRLRRHPQLRALTRGKPRRLVLGRSPADLNLRAPGHAPAPHRAGLAPALKTRHEQSRAVRAAN
jgi:hypothetical protein